MPERIKSDQDKGIPRDGGGRREGRRTIPQSGDEKQPSLRGLSEYSWQNRTGRDRREDGGADNRQYMVMVVASEKEPVYMGDLFRGQLDPIGGFLTSPQEPLNRLSGQRLFVAWFNNEPDFDAGRTRQEVFSLSTLQQKYFPWRPVAIDPTILNEDSGPLRYIHQVASNMHNSDPLALVAESSRSFSSFEKNMLAAYMELPLEDSDMDAFGSYFNNAKKKWQENRDYIIKNDRYLNEIFSNGREDGGIEPVNEYLENILAILVSFSAYQYNLSYNDDYSIDSIKQFLFNSEEGDCVEFSNTLALLGRIAGLPSRVVTGYLAAEELQTQAHLRGLANLRARIPVLQQFPFNNLFLVTNLHSHSWTQFYIPGYGWLDFEATAFAIPPEGTGDFNTWDVVIPIIDENKVFSQVRKFPWRAVLRTAFIMACIALVCAYALRYGREAFLYFGAQRGGRDGAQQAGAQRAAARSLYLLLLARLAADGRPIKPASRTALEYAELFPGEKGDCRLFADLYSQLRWREFADNAQRDECFDRLRREYRNILEGSRRKGMVNWFKRVLSLRGLAYL
uniref:Transglutaminase domain protein n=1 Tax=uncultured bacterium contig00059 TaxID=1181542 RepID=A0A0A6ZH26_9BACT|nr:transglutaminase domain protein [uncultured bacterium contig00059]